LDCLLLTFATQNQPKSIAPDLSSSGARAGEFRAAPSPERLARGRYIVEGPAHCFVCHGQPDFKKGLGQIIKNEAFNGEPFPDGLVLPKYHA
jgi:hypothetical protein